jgi:hypothetical protein
MYLHKSGTSITMICHDMPLSVLYIRDPCRITFFSKRGPPVHESLLFFLTKMTSPNGKWWVQDSPKWVASISSALWKEQWWPTFLPISTKQTIASPLKSLNIQYSLRHSVINHCDRRITLLSDTNISFCLFNLFTYFDMLFGW